MSDTKLFGDLTPFIDDLIRGMSSLTEASEAVLGYIVLPDGRKTQVTVKLNACEGEWIT